MWVAVLVVLVWASPALAGCPFLMTEEHGALKVESLQAAAQASLPPQCAGNTLLTNSRGDQFCVASQPSTTTRLRCSACECGIVRWTESPHERIVNGAEAPAHAYPWQIALFYPNYSREFWTRLLAFLEASNYPGLDEARDKAKKTLPRFRCGGSIISPLYVATAGQFLISDSE